MTTPEEDLVGTTLQQVLETAQRTAPPVDPGGVRQRTGRRVSHRRMPRLDVTIIITVAAVVIVAVVVLIVGPLGPHGRSPANTRPASPPATSTTTPSTTPPSTTPPSTTTPPSPSTSVPARTQVITYQPFTPDGAISQAFHITAARSGTCQENATSRSYRCFADQASGSGIYDPCIAGPRGTASPLVCPGDPTTYAVVEFSATAATGTPGTLSSNPWAVELSNGTVCALVNAAWAGLGPYDCQAYDASAEPADCHIPQQDAATWVIECQQQKANASPFVSYTVRTAWR